MSHAKCPKCHGTGRVSSLSNPNEPNKISAGWGSLRCDRCLGQGIVQGASGAGGSQQLGDGLMAIVAGLFLHPVFSFVGFWLICGGLMLYLLGSMLEAVFGVDMNSPPVWYFIVALGIPAALAVVFRKIIPGIMKWIFYIAIGGITLAFVGGIIFAIVDRMASS